MQNFFNNIRYRFSQFMIGRYGMDSLGQFMSSSTLVLVILNLFLHSSLLYWLVMFLIIFLYYRMFSRNISKRYQENQKFLAMKAKVQPCIGKYTGAVRRFFSRLTWNVTHFREIQEKNKGFHIYKCPKCAQKIRIPRGKGNIMVRCPKCGFEFHKKS